jgi:putative PepSY-like beta-lactamase-inhibitor
MKKLFFAIVTTAITVASASAQKLIESQLPAVVKSAFQKQYPNIKGSWEKEGANYEVNFKQDAKSMSSVIDKTGTILETETDITIKDLPLTAQDYLNSHYKGAKIKEASRIVKSNGEVNYEALMNGKDVIFDSNGKFIKTAKE